MAVAARVPFIKALTFPQRMPDRTNTTLPGEGAQVSGWHIPRPSSSPPPCCHIHYSSGVEISLLWNMGSQELPRALRDTEREGPGGWGGGACPAHHPACKTGHRGLPSAHWALSSKVMLCRADMGRHLEDMELFTHVECH